jgi:cell division protein ZapD
VIQQPSLTFEHPLNERIRTFLRTEYLFTLAKYRYNNLNSIWDSRDCIANIIELYNLIERTEFRSELLKEIERNINSLQRLTVTPSVDHIALDRVIRELEHSSEMIKNYPSRQGFFPKDSDLLNSIRQRVSIPGGTCSFDLPSFHFWLSLPLRERQECINRWVDVFEPLERALALVLNLTRQSAFPTQEVATEGAFNKALPTQTTCQLLRIFISPEFGVYPEISASKHRVNIRFITANFDQGKPMLANKEIQFDLTCCMMV